MNRTATETRMSASLRSLEDRINAKADAELEQEIEETIIARLRRNTPRGPIRCQFQATDGDVIHDVSPSGDDLCDALKAAMFTARQDTARRRAVEAFIERAESINPDA